MRNILYILLLTVCPFMGFAQKAKIDFENQSHDFGQILEKNGKVSYTFKFKNKGNSPLLVKHIETGCGCTAVKFTKQPILPQESGTIVITYNPKNRPGKFSKRILIYTNANPPNHVVKISGNVISDKGSEISYPFSFGDLLIDSNGVSLNSLKEKEQIINIKNEGKKTITVTSVIAPEYLMVELSPYTFRKNMIGNIYIKLTGDSSRFKKTDQILIRTDQGEQFNISIIAE